MDFQNFNLLDGIPVSIFSMLIVFIILMLLAVIISLLKYLPNKKYEAAKKSEAVKVPATAAAGGVSDSDSDEEERLVAMLTASCIAQGACQGDVRIISIERIK